MLSIIGGRGGRTLFAGGGALCAALYARGCGGWALFARGDGGDALLLLCVLEAVEGWLFAGGVGGAGRDVLCAALYGGGCRGRVHFRVSKFPLRQVTRHSLAPRPV